MARNPTGASRSTPSVPLKSRSPSALTVPWVVHDEEDLAPVLPAPQADAMGLELDARVWRQVHEAHLGIVEVISEDRAGRRVPGDGSAPVRRRHIGHARLRMDRDVLGSDGTGHELATAVEMGLERAELPHVDQ